MPTDSFQVPRDAKLTVEIRRWDGAHTALWFGEEFYNDLDGGALAGIVSGNVREMIADIKATPEKERIV